MPKTTINSIVVIFENEYNIHLSKISHKKIIYDGKIKYRKSIAVIMPTSKIYPRGNGWVDFTKIQVELLKQYQIAIATFRLSNGKNYFVDMKNLFPLLSQNNMTRQIGHPQNPPQLDGLKSNPSRNSTPLIRHKIPSANLLQNSSSSGGADGSNRW